MSVSRAPKIRALQIIADLEGTTRGPYAVCEGYFSVWWGERSREPARQ
jgi:anthranilate/para-aminobenzoate synthase component I